VERNGAEKRGGAVQARPPRGAPAASCPDIEIDERSGLVRVHDPRLFQASERSFCQRLLAAASEQPQMRRAEVNLLSATCSFEFGPGLATSDALADTFINILRQASAVPTNRMRGSWWRRVKDLAGGGRSRRSIMSVSGKRVPGGVKRLENLALAGGSFVMTLAGLVVPGIPTVPFLLATSYYLARSSPRLDERLRRTTFFGPILEEWEHHGGLSARSKEKLVGFSGLILVITVVVSPFSPVTLVVIVLMWFLSVYWITRLPGIPTRQGARLLSARPAAIALGAG
jgi:uncharacterized membrane protein YbaN (DUF454 family)